MYPNLSEGQIENTTAFFNSLDQNNTGFVTIAAICARCDDHYNQLVVIDETAEKYPSWIWTLQITNGYNMTSEITSEEYLDLGETFTELNATTERFEEIDVDQDGIITFSELLEAYKLPPVYIPQISPTHYWIENLKEQEDLIDETNLTLSDLLFYENKYNTTHIWNY